MRNSQEKIHRPMLRAIEEIFKWRGRISGLFALFSVGFWVVRKKNVLPRLMISSWQNSAQESLLNSQLSRKPGNEIMQQSPR